MNIYPKTQKFLFPEDLASYFSGDRIVCLRCGKNFKALGIHLKTMHSMSVEKYKKIYGIPWTYGLLCADTKAIKGEQAKEKYRLGIWEKPTAERARAANKLANRRPRQPVRNVLTKRNLDAMNEGKTGEDAIRRKNAPKRGTVEFRKKMANRPQSKNPSPNLINWWKGKKQSEDHKRKRFLHRTLLA